MKGYGFLSFAKKVSKNIGKYISKNPSSKYNQNILHHARQSATDALKTDSKRAIQKTAEATGDLVGNKIVDKITKVLRFSSQNNSEAGRNETENIGLDREIPKKRYISPEQRRKIVDGLRLI